MSGTDRAPAGSVSRMAFYVVAAILILALLALGVWQLSTTLAGHTTSASSRGAAGPAGRAGPAGAPGPSGSPGPRGERGTTGPAAPTLPGISGGKYYLVTSALVNSFVEIPTSNVSGSSSTISSKDLAGSTPIFDVNNHKVGTFSASLVALQSADGITEQTSNFFSTTGGLVVTWQKSRKLVNLDLDTFAKSITTTSRVVATTGSATYLGHTFSLVVSVKGSRIYFTFNPAR